jgi:alpha-tubulin suppressor-like RCC1 family protein
VSTAGAAYCWGYNTYGELGNNSTTQSTTAVAVSVAGVLAGVSLAQVSVGLAHVCVQDTTAVLYCWGLNSSGQVGNPDTGVNFLVPVVVSFQAIPLGSISAGFNHACLIRSGKAFCWGDNTYGELGNTSTTSSSVPVPVSTAGVLAGVTLTQVAAGTQFTCALSSAGAVYCWGLGTSGQLGNSASASSNVPVAVTSSGVLAGLTITQVTAGAAFACALSSTGLSFCWGLGTSGQLGNNGVISSNAPVAVLATGALNGKTLTQISGGGAFACGVSSLGLAYCWGYDIDGELGNTANSNSPVPAAVTATGVLAGLTLTQVTTGASSACALASTTAAFCWGLGTSGQLGNGASSTSNVPVTVTSTTGLVGTQISAGGTTACALYNGVASCWGSGGNGQLGNGTTTAAQNVPVAVTTSGALAGVSLGEISVGTNFVCALDTTGLAYCWGSNSSGQDGNPVSTTQFLVPVLVQSAASSALAAIATGYNHACLIRNASAYCWGDNTEGELGNNSTVSSLVQAPVYTGGVLAGVTLTQITTGTGSTCALSAAGAAYCWGDNSQGELGNNSAAAQSNVPVAVSTAGVLSGVTLTQITAGLYFACGLGSTGAAY